MRNHTLVLGINGLAMRVAERIAGAVTGALCVATTSGRGQIEPDLGSHLDQLVGIGLNPNVGALLVVGVDAETTGLVLARIEAGGAPVAAVSFAEFEEDMLGVLDAGIRRLAHLARRASSFRREPAHMSELFVGVECGHSDATSGIVSNPVVGHAVDALIDRGASVVLGETIEWLGAEHLLARRARDKSVSASIIAAVKRREDRAAGSGRSLTGNNPGEENIRGGLSTIEEKSLGAVIKSGTRPIDALLGHGERPAMPGLFLMDGPSFSPESITGFVAAGAQLTLFTTGPGNSYASVIAPTIKITGQPRSAARLREQIDFDASAVLSGTETNVEVGRRLLDTIRSVSDGDLTWGEILGEGGEVPTRLLGSL